MEKQYQVTFPEEVTTSLALHSQETLELSIVNGELVLRNPAAEYQGQKISLRWFLLPSFLSTLFFFIYFYFQKMSQIPLTGQVSIAASAIVLSLISGMLSFTICFIRIKQQKVQAAAKDIYWRNLPSIWISFAIITLLALLFFFKILGAIFYGASFDLFTAALLFFAINASVNYTLLYLALEINVTLLLNLMIFVIIGGVFGAMMTNNDNQWWQFNFSFLGTEEARASWQFNFTLILSAVLMIALVDFLFVHLKKKYPGRKTTILWGLLVLVALNLGGVGAFPYVENSIYATIHNQVASNLVYLIILLILFIRYLLPVITKEFQYISYLIMGMLVTSLVLFQGIHYFSLTVFELISFILAFSWLLLLFQQLQKLLTHGAKTYTVLIEEKKTF